MLEPSDRNVLTSVTRWFTTCINQPQFLKVLGKIALCEKMVPVTPKTNVAADPKPANGSPAVDSADATANGKEVLFSQYMNIYFLCKRYSIFLYVPSFRPTKDRSPAEERS